MRCQIKNIFMSSGGMVHEAYILLQKEMHRLEAEGVHHAAADILKLLHSAQEALEEGSSECYEQQVLRCQTA